MEEGAKPRGRPPHEPTEASRKQVEAFAAYGIKQEEIAAVVGLSHVTLRKHYRHELNVGAIQANAAVAQSLFHEATQGRGRGKVAACIFWLKVRAGWSERQILRHEGADGGAVKIDAGFERFVGLLDAVVGIRASGAEPPDGMGEDGEA